MEDWEREFREKLQRELPEGTYFIRTEHDGMKFDIPTSKRGQIEFLIALHREVKKRTYGKPKNTEIN